jgi:hypothetical protein
MRLFASIVALLAPASALAGGVAPIVAGGFHTEQVFFYQSDYDPATPDRPIAYTQFEKQQIIGNIGTGLELMLGDRDDLIQGVFRGYWSMDTPQINPSKYGLMDDSQLIEAVRTETRHVGIGTVGINWGVARAAQEKFKFSIDLNVGAAFLTNDNREFMLAQAGANAGYLVSRQLEVFVSADYALRFRKQPSHGFLATAGLRVLFD